MAQQLQALEKKKKNSSQYEELHTFMTIKVSIFCTQKRFCCKLDIHATP